MLTFVWHFQKFQDIDAMPEGEMSTDACHIRILKIFSSKLLLGMEKGERRLIMHTDNARLHTAKVTRAFCDDNFLRITPNSPYSPDLTPSDFFMFQLLKTASKDNSSSLHMDFFRRSEKFKTTPALTLSKRFSKS
jgi:histone-lysine N-methyltransferase SETMAR